MIGRGSVIFSVFVFLCLLTTGRKSTVAVSYTHLAILVMLGSATTVSSFIVAKNMGHEGSLTANTVMLTTCGSAFTLTFWLYLMKTLAFI